MYVSLILSRPLVLNGDVYPVIIALIVALPADYWVPQPGTSGPPFILHFVSGIVLEIFNGIALLFLVWDTFVGSKRSLLSPYNIFAGYPAQKHNRWGVLFGVSPWKSRFRCVFCNQTDLLMSCLTSSILPGQTIT